MTAALRHATVASRLRASWNDASVVQDRIDELAARIEEEWRARGWCEDAFADVALGRLRAFLDERGLPSHELAHWIFSPHHSTEHPLPFGAPPQVELYRSTRFRIEAAFWFQSLTEIVDHGYAGVIAVLEGLAARSEWSFEEQESLSDGVRRGELLRTGVALLRPGSMRAIRPGEAFIEQTMYLEPTCVTLCIRTNAARPSSCYRPPGIAFHRREPNTTRARQLAVLASMPAKSVPFAAETCAAQVVRGGTLLDAIEVLSFMSAHGYDRSLIQEVCEQTEDVHGEAIELVGRSLELGAQRRVLESTEVGKDPRHRLLLFLLLQLPSKAAMVELLAREYPQEHAERLLWRWLHEARAAFGLEDDELGPLLLEGLFHGSTEAQLLDRLRKEFDPRDIETLTEEIRGLCHQLLAQPIFQGLFSEVAWRPSSRGRTFECVLDRETLRTLPHAERFGALEPSFIDRLVLNPNHHVQGGNELPPALEGRVPFSEELSRRAPILWVREPTTRHWMPYWLPAPDSPLLMALQQRHLDPADVPDPVLRQMVEAGILISPDDADGRIGAWQQTIRRARESYMERGYAILPGLVNPLWVASLRRHYRALHESGAFLDEEESLGNVAMYLEGATRFLQHQLVHTVTEIVGEDVVPSFCYTRTYGERAKLYRHTDRPNCVWNISIPYDLVPETERPECWPLHVDCDGNEAEIRLEMGDGALFRGVSAEHWRDPQPAGHRSTFGFLMYAPTTFKGTLY